MDSEKPEQPARFWAWTFFVLGLCALACFPAVLLFERFDWFEAPVHLTAFAACVLCVVSALMFLLKVGGTRNDGTLLSLPTRKLAYVALILAGGFLLLVAGFFVLMMVLPSDF